ncbi:pentapeptide repeat-containing protein [Xenorhabdus littoralis]|uniref:pentapeptide repeat-containing protein n=1 Tax=Xenorhabdus littoralis TaxID=2582835 RepID=UPI0029E80A80|nr:pentapeptide repeat-containing protein [Xenorhabdus sp. psl]MDX7991753.1 pentapeptide repeat-containing protein [Xenorhabdus sp. psl]
MHGKKLNLVSFCSFASGSFESVDFSTVCTERQDMSEANFNSCSFYNNDTSSGNTFTGSNLRNTLFTNCDLSMCSFAFADLFGAEFINCRLIGTSFESASFAEQLSGKKYFCSGKIENSNLSSACLAGLLLHNCSLKGNRWNDTDIEKTDFNGADLSGGEFSGICWTDASFTGCDLRGASLQGLDIRKVNLSGVKLDSWQISQLVSVLGVIVT